MAVTASRTTQLLFSGDITESLVLSAADNTTAIAKTDNISLASGDNTITPPSITGLTIVAVTIIPPAGNTILITLKGAAADTNPIPLHKTDHTTLGLNSTITTFILNAASAIANVRLVWS